MKKTWSIIPNANGGEVDILDLFNGLSAAEAVFWKQRQDPTIWHVVTSIVDPLQRCLECLVVNVLSVMRAQPADAKVQADGVRVLECIMFENSTMRQLVHANGAAQVLVFIVTSHQADELLVGKALRIIQDLHGIIALVEVLDQMRSSAAAVGAALWALKKAGKDNFEDLVNLPPGLLVKSVLTAAQTHPKDDNVLFKAMSLLGDMMGDPGRYSFDSGHFRSTFAAVGGWDWLLKVVEHQRGQPHLQQIGLRMISQLCRGGSWSNEYESRASAVVQEALFLP